MKKRAGITRIDLVVALACLFFVMANVQIITAGGRYRAKREVCMANLRTLTAAWAMYSNDHNGHLPCADVGYSEDILWEGNPLAYRVAGPGWFRWPHIWPGSPTQPGPDRPEQGMSQWLPGNPSGWPEADWKHAIWHGSLWTYIGDYEVYRCPVGLKNEYVTYQIAHSMNAYPGVFAYADWTIYYNYQINQPAQRMVFIDTGYASNGAFGVVGGSSSVSQDPATRGFFDVPPKRHENGTTFSFVDGHAGYRKWVDQRTVNYIWGDLTNQRCNQDMYWLQKVVWGKVTFMYPPQCPPEF